MPTIRLDPLAPDPDAIRRAADVIRKGGLVAFPTETVYGLGANGLDSPAVHKIFEAKGRPSFNPVILHIENAEGAQSIVQGWPEIAAKLAERFWPGPLTFVLPKKAVVPDAVTAGLPSVAVRVPAHPIAQALLRECGLPIAAPSANKFTQLSPTNAAHVAQAFGDDLLVLDGGPCTVGIESTVLDLSSEMPVLLRPGGITREAIEAVIGEVALPQKLLQGETPRPSPGMIERHYAPRARLVISDGDSLSDIVTQALSAGQRVGILAFSGYKIIGAETLIMPGDAPSYARAIYAALHQLDGFGCGIVFVEEPPCAPEWLGIRDRLQRASKQG